MTIDEFLLSEEMKATFNSDTFLKLKYNDNISFIYRPSYGDFECGSNLECIGVFENSHKELYGFSYYFDFSNKEELKSTFYKGGFEKIKTSLQNDINSILNNYIKVAINSLRDNAKDIFNKYISYEGNYNYIKNNAIKNYIYNKPTPEFYFSINSYFYEKNRNEKSLLMEYLRFPQQISYEIYKEYIEQEEKNELLYSHSYNEPRFELAVKEYIGVSLLERDLEDKLLEELKENPNNEYKKKHDIVSSIDGIDAQNLTITIEHESERISFKYPKNLLYQFEFYSSHIPDLQARETIENWYCGHFPHDKMFINEIVSIEYKKKVLYEDKEMQKSQNQEQNIDDIDITDDMF